MDLRARDWHSPARGQKPTGKSAKTFCVEDWRVVADSGKCIQCGACVVGRPQRALKLVLVTRGSAGALDAFATLSTAANSEENKEATTKIGISSVVSMRGSVGLCGYMLDLAAKGTYYLNCKMGQASISAIAFKGGEPRIRATCRYL